MKEKEEFVFEKQFEVMANRCKEMGVVIPSYCFKTYDEKIKYAAYIYFNDKNEYLKTGIWPTKKFLQRDLIWTYYYYLQVTDSNIDLEKYFDFSYDTNKWTKEDIINLMLKYGTNVLFKFAIYTTLKTSESFDEWYIDYQKENNLENIQETLYSFNTFNKSTRK